MRLTFISCIDNLTLAAFRRLQKAGVWMHSRQAVAAPTEEEMFEVFLADGQGSRYAKHVGFANRASNQEGSTETSLSTRGETH